MRITLNKIAFTASLALALTSVLSCSSADSPDSPAPDSSSEEKFGYCIFMSEQICLSGPFSSCQAGGTLSNDCPYHNEPTGNVSGISSSGNGNSSNASSSSIAIAFVAPSSVVKGTFTDRDGIEYKTVKIGSQTWFAENLKYDASGSKCYDNSQANCDKYGKLYDWNAAMTACPPGWHLPTRAEWSVLTVSVGGEATEGKVLKATSGWSYGGVSGNGTDAYGFAALPGGSVGPSGSFFGAGGYGDWWSANEYDANNAYERYMLSSAEYASWGHYDKNNYYSVRCLQDFTNVSSSGNGNSSGASSSSSSSRSSTSSITTASSSSITVVVPSSVVKGTFTDTRDGEEYKTVKIGSQTWFAENLKYNASGSACYDNDQANCDKYGKLYNWATAGTACPSGWHLPSKAEWDVLTVSVGGEATEGKVLKATSGWSAGNGTDAYGFAALPGGFGSAGDFDYVGNNGYWWSASEDVASFTGSSFAYLRRMSDDDEYAYGSYGNQNNYFSVRCLQD